MLQVATAVARPTRCGSSQVGFDAFLDQCLNPEVQRIVMLDGPTVLGWDLWHELDERYAFGTIKTVLTVAADTVGSSSRRSIRCRTCCSAPSCRPAWSWRGPTTR